MVELTGKVFLKEPGYDYNKDYQSTHSKAFGFDKTNRHLVRGHWKRTVMSAGSMVKYSIEPSFDCRGCTTAWSDIRGRMQLCCVDDQSEDRDWG